MTILHHMLSRRELCGSLQRHCACFRERAAGDLSPCFRFAVFPVARLSDWPRCSRCCGRSQTSSSSLSTIASIPSASEPSETGRHSRRLSLCRAGRAAVCLAAFALSRRLDLPDRRRRGAERRPARRPSRARRAPDARLGAAPLALERGLARRGSLGALTGSFDSFVRTRHVSPGRCMFPVHASGPHAYLEDAALYHLDLVANDHAAREAKVTRYEHVRPGLRLGALPLNAAYYLPELQHEPFRRGDSRHSTLPLIRFVLDAEPAAAGAPLRAQRCDPGREWMPSGPRRRSLTTAIARRSSLVALPHRSPVRFARSTFA